MSADIPGWNPEIERSFKEVLFRFLEEVQSTKAALYLLAGDGSYRLATHYGFRKRDLLSTEHVVQDPLVKKVRELRNQVFVVNNLQDFPEISDYLEGAGTARLLLVPLYAGSRVLGFVDARDKGRKRVFEAADTKAAEGIAKALLELVGRARMYDDVGAASGSVARQKRRKAPVVAADAAAEQSPRTVLLDQRGLRQIHQTVLSMTRVQGVVAIALTVVDRGRATTLLSCGEASGEVELDALQRHQVQALRQTDAAAPDPSTWRCETRRVPKAGNHSANRIVATAVLLSSDSWSLLASVVALGGSGTAAEVLERLHWECRCLADLVAARKLRWSFARRLLAPGQRAYPELEQHSTAVARLSWRLARALGWDDARCDEAALTGLLHDVGMREIEYDTLYRHPSPGSEERSRYRQHVLIGEKILAASGLEGVALAIRHHHERWDGKGYPDRLPGVAIPHLARLVHLAEVFDVLTGSHSYRQPVGTQRALSVIRSASGQQFDPDLVDLLARVVE